MKTIFHVHGCLLKICICVCVLYLGRVPHVAGAWPDGAKGTLSLSGCQSVPLCLLHQLLPIDKGINLENIYQKTGIKADVSQISSNPQRDGLKLTLDENLFQVGVNRDEPIFCQSLIACLAGESPQMHKTVNIPKSVAVHIAQEALPRIFEKQFKKAKAIEYREILEQNSTTEFISSGKQNQSILKINVGNDAVFVITVRTHSHKENSIHYTLLVIPVVVDESDVGSEADVYIADVDKSWQTIEYMADRFKSKSNYTSFATRLSLFAETKAMQKKVNSLKVFPPVAFIDRKSVVCFLSEVRRIHMEKNKLSVESGMKWSASVKELLKRNLDPNESIPDFITDDSDDTSLAQNVKTKLSVLEGDPVIVKLADPLPSGQHLSTTKPEFFSNATQLTLGRAHDTSLEEHVPVWYDKKEVMLVLFLQSLLKKQRVLFNFKGEIRVKIIDHPMNSMTLEGGIVGTIIDGHYQYYISRSSALEKKEGHSYITITFHSAEVFQKAVDESVPFTTLEENHQTTVEYDDRALLPCTGPFKELIHNEFAAIAGDSKIPVFYGPDAFQKDEFLSQLFPKITLFPDANNQPLLEYMLQQFPVSSKVIKNALGHFLIGSDSRVRASFTKTNSTRPKL